MSEIKPVAWTLEAALAEIAAVPERIGHLFGKASTFADSPIVALCRHDEAMAEIERLTNERDAAFAMSRCECGTDEACANLVAKDDEIERLREQLVRMVDIAEERLFDIERLQAENAKYKDLYRVQSGQMIELMAENGALIQRLAPIVLGHGSSRDTIAAKAQNIFAETLSVDGDGDIMGTGPASYRISDLLINAVAEARNKALDEAAAYHQRIYDAWMEQRSGMTSQEAYAEGETMHLRLGGEPFQHKADAAAIIALKVKP